MNAALTCPACSTVGIAGNRFCENCGHDLDAVPSAAGDAGEAGAVAGATDADEPADDGWELVVGADRTFYDSLESTDVTFPDDPAPDLLMAISGDRVDIGRRSTTRAWAPAVDLGDPPVDSGVSHAHAVLCRRPDGGWSITDEGSANGTFVNTEPDPIPVGTPIFLDDGDQVHIGAWTTLTIRRANRSDRDPGGGAREHDASG